MGPRTGRARADFVAGGTRDALRARVAEIAHVEPFRPPVKRGNRHFYLRFPAIGPGQATALLLRETGGGPSREIIRSSDLPENGRLAQAIPDGTGRRAVHVTTQGGSSWGTVRVRDVESGTDICPTS